MRVLFNIGHPAQVHLFKNVIWELEKRGHECKITVITKDVSIQLLEAYGFQYEIVGMAKPSIISKMIEMILVDLRLVRIAYKFRPDVLVGGVGNVYITHVGCLIHRPSIVFDDTEHALLDHLLMDPFVSAILTPSCFRKELGSKQIRFEGYKELASLHPNRFTPNPSVLTELGLDEKSPFIIVRFVSWQASHDVGQHGISDKVGLVKSLEPYGRILISSEGAIPEELQGYGIRFSPEKIHDFLYFSTLYIGEGATMASEAAMLGIPSIFVSSLSGTMGNFIELEKDFGLLYSFSDEKAALSKAIGILSNSESKEDWKKKKYRMGKMKIDVTAFMTWFIETYPESLAEMKDEPKVQKRFLIDNHESK